MRPRPGYFRALAAGASAILLCLAASARACPTCKDAFGRSPQTAGLANGFYYTILLMLGVVFSLIGLLVLKIVREARKDSQPSGQSPIR